MNLFSEKNMIYWEKNNDAAQYVVYLYISAECISKIDRWTGKRTVTPVFLNDKHDVIEVGNAAKQVIDVITVQKEKTYHTFKDLVSIRNQVYPNGESHRSGLTYQVLVTAEDRNGNKLDESALITLSI